MGPKDHGSLLDLSFEAATLLEYARVICFTPKQVEALPSFEDDPQLFDFCVAYAAPAPVVYLDFEIGGNAVDLSELADTGVKLRGALVSDARTDDRIDVFPFLGTPGEAKPPFGFDARVAIYHSLGWEGAETEKLVTQHDPKTGSYHATVPLTQLLGNPDGRHYLVDPAAPQETLDRLAANDSEALNTSVIAARLAERALAALALLEIEGAELEPKALERRVQRRAEKRRWPIADVVRFRRRVTDPEQPRGRRGKVGYSHRFFVIGHTRHYPAGTKIGDADGGRHLTPCARTRCQGRCRKVRVRTYIKGPEDKPLKPKTLIVSTDDPQTPRRAEDAA